MRLCLPCKLIQAELYADTPYHFSSHFSFIRTPQVFRTPSFLSFISNGILLYLVVAYVDMYDMHGSYLKNKC